MFCPACQAEWPAEWKVCPKDATNLLRSAQIGKYSIEGLLGVGGMGAVYRATNPDTKGAVAIKVMNPEVASSEALRQRFQREAGVVAKLRTSHVTKVYDFGTEPDGTLYLVMEKLDGHTLREEILPAPEYMDLARVLMVMDGSLKGLAAAHKAGIVHRDLKPENIYIADTDDGEVPKLLDFGIARVRTRDSNLTRTGSLMGTASYMAPEQVTAQGDIGPWTDVYAMGGILYECLAGAPAVGGNTITEVLQRVMRSEVVPLASVRGDLPAAVYRVVERCMHPDPTQRPADADAMRALLASANLVAPGAQVPPPSKTRSDVPVVPPIVPPGAASVASSAFGPTVRAATGPGSTVAGVGAGTGPGHVHHPTPTATPTPKPATSPGSSASGFSTPAATAMAALQAASTHTSGDGERMALPPPAKKSMAPMLAIGGVIVIGGAIAAFVATRKSASSTPDPPVRKDAGAAVAVADAPPAPPPDAAIAVAAIDSAIVRPQADAALVDANDPRAKMIYIEPGEHDIGEDAAAGHPECLKRDHVTAEALSIDPAEMTLGELRAALKSNAGGLPTDKPELPARKVTYAQAEAACKALGKRLPTEIEWEVASLTTPRDPKLALPAKSVDLGPSKRVGDCSSAGLCDMLGSVAEWTSTNHPDKAGAKVVRGSTYQFVPDGSWESSIHARHAVLAKETDDEVGFRCAMSKP